MIAYSDKTEWIDVKADNKLIDQKSFIKNM